MSKSNKPGWIWYEKKGRWRPFTEFREIRKGKNAGMFEVLLPATPARKVIVPRGAIRSFPVSVNVKGEQEEPGLFEVNGMRSEVE